MMKDLYKGGNIGEGILMKITGVNYVVDVNEEIYPILMILISNTRIIKVPLVPLCLYVILYQSNFTFHIKI